MLLTLKKHHHHVTRFLPAVAFAYLFFLLSGEVLQEHFQDINLFFNENINTLYSATFTHFMLGITFLMNAIPAIIFSFLLGMYFLFKKNYKNFFTAAFTLGFGALSKIVLKALTEISRPENGLIGYSDNSYPSGHTTISTIFFSLLIYFFANKIKNHALRILFIAINIFFILAISFSRLYLNAHWFSDVLGGIIFGLFWISLAIGVRKYYLN